MRHLILTVGTPACGKSTWIKENNLEQYTVCPDKIRLLIESPRYDVKGALYISQKNDRKVWELVFEIIEERMKRGEFIVVDATHSRSRLINRYKKLAEKYRYRIIAVDFRMLNLSLEEILERNRNRKPDYKKVPEEAIKNIYERLKTMKIPSGVKVIHPDEFKQLENILFDFNEYDNVVFIGDIHGCYNELISLMVKIKKNVKDKSSTMFVFAGDYFDRGKYNTETFRYLYELMKDDEFNSLFLTGNHELRLYLYKEFYKLKKQNETNKLKEFIKENRIPDTTIETFNQFLKIGIHYKEVMDFYKRLGQLAYFKFGDRIYVVTHGGIPNIPNIYQATEDFIKGVGRYEDSEIVDKSFMENAPDNYYQVHGHRNIFNVDIKPYKRIFNINGNAEWEDGELRAVIVDKEGNEILIRQPSIDGKKRVINSIKKLDKKFNDDSILTMMKSHNFVKVKEHENKIYSCNFTSKAFYKKKWDDITVKARGLFIGIDNNNEEVILVRGYNKFFNLNEREETKLSNLKNLKYPVVAYRKYNGFLGLLSVDKRKEYYGNWLIHTKGSTKGEFVEMFKEIVSPYLTEELKQFILDNNVTFIFEVIHHNDRHIEEYDKNKVVLLDVVSNEVEEKKLSYSELVKVAEKFNFEYKKIMKVLNNYKELYDYIQELESVDVFIDNYIEGVVLEDEEGFKVKIKTNWYKFWKWVRKLKDEMRKMDLTRRDVVVNKTMTLHKYEENVVFNTLLKNQELLNRHVIDIRKHIIFDKKVKHNIGGIK